MGRVSQAQAALHRKEVIETTSRLVRERGLAQVSVPDAMGAAGLTHGGFYRHFRSKEDLLAAACSAAFDEQLSALSKLVADENLDRRSAYGAFVARYLSTEHRDDPGSGCANPALAAEVSRTRPDSPVREAYREGLRRGVELLGKLGERPIADDAREREVLVELATLVGAMLLARASNGDELSERILLAVHDHLRQEGADR
jgi:TetR/AcrR family transcriptional repressor of nem operon